MRIYNETKFRDGKVQERLISRGAAKGKYAKLAIFIFPCSPLRCLIHDFITETFALMFRRFIITTESYIILYVSILLCGSHVQ